MLVYGRDTVLQVVHNRGHGFQKVLTRPGCTNSNTHSINLGKTKSKPNEAFTTKQSQDSEIFQGGHPLSRSRNGVSKLRDGLKVCDNGCKRLGTRKLGVSIPRNHSAYLNSTVCSTSHNRK